MTDPVLLIGKESDTGPVRERNEDYVDYYVPMDDGLRQAKGALFLVADGMGGHRAGQVASRTVVERVRHEYYKDRTRSVTDSLTRAIKVANREVYNRGQSDSSLTGMGTTLVAAIIRDRGRQATIANVGDSRAYLLRRTQLTQITVDHSWVEAQLRAGLLTREQAQKHPQRNLITRALGIQPTVEVDIFQRKLRKGDALLLCTDGVSGELSDEQMADLIQARSPSESAAELVLQANALGGNDNATALVVRAEPGSRLLGLPPLPTERAASREYWGLAVGMIVLLLCLVSTLLAAMLVIQGASLPQPRAAPRSGPIHFESLHEGAMAGLAQKLGYQDPGRMQAEPGNQLDTQAQEADLWPVKRGVFLAGRAQACPPQAEGCDFALNMAGTDFQVDLLGKGAIQDYSGRRVWVFGHQQQEGGPVVAQEVDVVSPIDQRWPLTSLWLRPKWTAAYKVQDGSGLEPVWVYAVADEYPNTPLLERQRRNLDVGEPVLVHGRWQQTRGLSPMILYADEIYRLDEDGQRYVPVAPP